jgi:hypothetical protein
MRTHPEQERLERLPGAVDADVRQGGRREDPPCGVARLGLQRLLVDEVGVAGLLRIGVARPLEHLRETGRVGVEHGVHVGDVAGAEWRVEDFGRPVVAIPPAQSRVVRDVARGLLEVGHETAPLEDLGEDVRRLLAREVYTAELGDGVVAVLEEHPLVELLGALEADAGVDADVVAEVEITDELVEEQPPEAFGAA